MVYIFLNLFFDIKIIGLECVFSLCWHPYFSQEGTIIFIQMLKLLIRSSFEAIFIQMLKLLLRSSFKAIFIQMLKLLIRSSFKAIFIQMLKLLIRSSFKAIFFRC